MQEQEKNKPFFLIPSWLIISSIQDKAVKGLQTEWSMTF